MPFAARLALLCAIAATTLGAVAPHQEPLAQLLDRMRSHAGPVWRAHLSSSSLLAVGDQTASVQSEAQGVRFATYECAQTLCTGSYFDGGRIFAIDMNGTALPQSDLPDEFLRAERIIASHEFLDVAFTDNGGHISDDGWATIDSIRYRMLTISEPDTEAMQIYVDPSTALVRYMRDVNGDATLEYRDYRHIEGGLMLPFLVLRNGAALERYENRTILPGSFDEPRGLIPTFDGPAAEVQTDPSRSIPIFPCTLGGVATSCLLDTGNSGVAVSLELAKRLQAPTVGEIQVAGLGRYATQVVRSGPLRVGNATFPAANYVVLNDIHRFGYDVVLGADVLASTRVALDPVRHQISFDAPAPSNAVSVRMHFQNFVPIVAVQLGKLGAQLAVDTGDESSINLSYDFYSEHRDLFSATEQRTVSGVGGSSIELIGQIPNVRIGDLNLHDQRIGTTTTLHSTAYGHLGAAFLSQFNVLLDYARGQVDFVPASPAP